MVQVGGKVGAQGGRTRQFMQRRSMDQLESLISSWRNIYSQQGQTGKVLLSCFPLLAICLLCSLSLALFRPRSSVDVSPTPNIFPGQGSAATPTALFNFGRETFTPYPTFPSPTAPPTFTALPTTTQAPTQTPTSTSIPPTATLTPMPTSTMTSIPPTSAAPLAILFVEKKADYVDIKNISNQVVNLSGWKLLSVYGKQSCDLGGVLEPNATLRVWARTGDTGFSCQFPKDIWNDNRADVALLYNPLAEELSRYP